MSEGDSREVTLLQLRLKAHLAEYKRLSDEINTRLAKEGTVVQVFLGFIAGIFTIIMYADVSNKVMLIAFLLPPIEILFMWFYSAHHIKLKKCCTHADWISGKVNNLLDDEVLTWDRKGVTQNLGELESITVTLSRTVTHEVFFALIVVPTIILVIFKMGDFNAIPELDLLSFRFGHYIGVIYILLLTLNLVVIFLIYKKDIWLYQDEKNNDLRIAKDLTAIPEKTQMEYKELCAYHRHQRELTWKMGSILITASLAVLGIIASRFDVLPLSVLILSGIVSVIILVLFWLIFERMSFLNDTTKARMEEIEQEYGMCIVQTYKEGSKYGKKTHHPVGKVFHMRWVVRTLVFVYMCGWGLLWIVSFLR